LRDTQVVFTSHIMGDNKSTTPKKSLESKQKQVEHNKKKREEYTKLQDMISEKLKINKNDILDYLFKQAGYDYNPITYKVIGRPSKFGGQWRESELGEDKEEVIGATIIKEKEEEFCESSLLENNKFIEFVQQPLCDMCGGVWSCRQASGHLKQRATTEGKFMLQCTHCPYKKMWTTQHEGGLNTLFLAATKLCEGIPDKINAICKMIKTGCDEGQQLYGEVVKKLIPIIGSPASRKYNQQFCGSALFDADSLSGSAHSFLRIHCGSAVISL